MSNVTFAGDDRVTIFEDFNLKAGATLSLPWVEVDVSSAGTPTSDFSGDWPGEWEVTQAATNENEITGIAWDGCVSLDPAQNLVFEARVKLTATGGAMASTERMVVGLASAHNNDLDAITNSVWFRVGDAASMDVKIESDDGTTDTNDQATDFSYTNDTYHTYKIDMSDLSNVRFVFDGQDCGSVDVSAMTSSNGLQPFIEIQKDGDAEEDSIEVDYIKVSWDRV